MDEAQGTQGHGPGPLPHRGGRCGTHALALLNWYRRLGLPINDGYGLTENLAVSHLTIPGHSAPLQAFCAGSAYRLPTGKQPSGLGCKLDFAYIGLEIWTWPGLDVLALFRPAQPD
ncbi:MAG: hypothetical protein WA147_15750 [Polaromonas sp.]